MAESISLTKFKTLDHLRFIRQFRRKANSDRRKIYAFDIEATSNGDMLLLANNNGDRIDLNEISPENVLKFLFCKRYQTSWCFFWNLHYDARIILRMILLQSKENEILKFYRTDRIKFLDFNIWYMEKKVLAIRKGHHSVNFFDIQQYFGMGKSLADAYQENISQLPKEYLQMKELRQYFSHKFYNRNKNKVRQYCIQDCKYIKQLSEFWVDLFKDAFSFYPARWISSGYLAEKVLINNGTYIPKFDQSPRQVQELAWNSYIGSRTELIVRGHVDYACIYDINSAYTYALTKIPDFTNGNNWIQSNKIETNSHLGFFKIRCNIPSKNLSPFPFTVKKKVVFPIGEFETFVTLDDLKASEDSSWYEILDSWQYVDAAPYYPYQKIINDWYNYRMELKAKGSKLEQPFKIILNSIYGKTAQRVNEKIGNMFNPIIATTITGKARSMLYDFIIKNRIEDDVIMMYTDSVTCKKNLNLSSKKLGDFSLDFEGSIYTIQSGFYSKNGVWKSRGFGQIGDDTISSRAPTVDHKGRIIYEFERTHVGTIKQNILRNEIQNIGKFSMQKRKMNPNADRGRFWLGRLTDARKTETNYSSPFMLPVFDPSKI